MVAAANGTSKEALEWFERLQCPHILAPETRRAKQPVKLYVPNNSSDVKRDGTDRIEKVFQPQVLTTDQPVHYLYEVGSSVHPQAKAIAEIARQVSALGWGIDSVVVDARTIAEKEAERLRTSHQGKCFRPLNSGNGQNLRVPVAGSFNDLAAAYQSARSAFDGLRYTFPRKTNVFGEVGYMPDGVPARHCACLRMLVPNEDGEKPAAFDPRYASHIASWVRGYLCRESQRENSLGIDPEVYIAGHVERGASVTPPRFSYLPLPTIGHPEADGLVRRVIVAEPFGDDGTKAEWAAQALDCALLTDQNGAIRSECRADDPANAVFREHTRPARYFKTVTPVILPGFDDHQYAKAEKLLIKAFAQAGLPLDKLQDFSLQKAHFFKNGCTPEEYRRPKHLKNYSAMHVKLTLKDDLQGPLAIGAGRHRGLGLFAAVAGDHESHETHKTHAISPRGLDHV